MRRAFAHSLFFSRTSSNLPCFVTRTGAPIALETQKIAYRELTSSSRSAPAYLRDTTVSVGGTRASLHSRAQLMDLPAAKRAKTMVSHSNSGEALPKIELTPIENTLRRLLLDVVDYINANQEHTSHSMGEGLVLRFTGGWVRDKLLGAQSVDIDVGISCMTGYQFGLALKEYLDIPGNLEKYKKSDIPGLSEDKIVKLHKIQANPEKSKHLETVTTTIFGLQIDLVNMRKETYHEESRNPEMEFGTPEEDSLRRDATVNALFYNLNTDSVEDFTGKGLQDMKNKNLRTPLPPYQTFKDDPLRILRLIRFASRLGYTIDGETAEAMKHPDIGHALKLKISPERIGTEIQKTLRGPDPLGALEFIDKNGLFGTIFSNNMDDVKADTLSWSTIFHSFGDLLNESSEASPVSISTHQFLKKTLLRDEEDVYYGWLLAAIAPWATVPLTDDNGNVIAPTTKKPSRCAMVLRDQLRLDNKTISIAAAGATHYDEITNFKETLLNEEVTTDSPQRRLETGLFLRSLGAEWRLCCVIALLLECAHKDRTIVFDSYKAFLSRIVEMDLIDIHHLRPLVNGKEICAGLGVPSGPWMAKALAVVIEWQLLHPESAEKEPVLEEIRNKKNEIGWDQVTGKPAKSKNKK